MLCGGQAFRGAGLQQLALSSLKTLSPYHWAQKIKQYNKNTAQTSTLNDYENDMAHLARNAYGTKHVRNHHKDYQYRSELSGDNYAVYRNDKTNKNYLVYKGTSDRNDILPDYSIVTGYQNYDSSFKNADQTYQALKDKLTGSWETVGHSLGGSKAMVVAQNNNLTSHAFNPGYNNYFDDQINTGYQDHHVYVRQGDPVSNSILTEDLKNVKLLPSVGWSPLANHSIETIPT